MNLAERLKTDTRVLHIAAERSAFMGELLRGRMERGPYATLLRNLHAIYAALEPALAQHAHHPSIAPVFEPALRRQQALEQDLNVLHGPAWRTELAVQPAARDHADRLHHLAATQPGPLLAHAYVRYLGDLSGGQMLSRIVADRMTQAEGRSPTAFYDFGDAAETLRLTQAFRAGLDKVALDSGELDGIVAEAKLAFELHRRLFDELARANGLLTASDADAQAE